MNSKYTKELLEPIVKKSFTFSDVLRELSVKIKGGSVAHLKKNLQKFEIDFTHFKGRGWAKDRLQAGKRGRTKEQFIETFLRKDGNFIITYHLKNQLFKFKIKENKCEKCGNLGVWKNEPLTLQIDHINGERDDNRLENLRILCPNCHTQTKTYSGKNNN